MMKQWELLTSYCMSTDEPTYYLSTFEIPRRRVAQAVAWDWAYYLLSHRAKGFTAWMSHRDLHKHLATCNGDCSKGQRRVNGGGLEDVRLCGHIPWDIRIELKSTDYYSFLNHRKETEVSGVAYSILRKTRRGDRLFGLGPRWSKIAPISHT